MWSIGVSCCLATDTLLNAWISQMEIIWTMVRRQNDFVFDIIFFFSFCDYILSPQRFLQDWSFYRRAVENYRCSIMQWVIRIYLSTNSERPTVRAFTTYKWLKMEKIVLLFKILKPYKGVFPSSNLFCLAQRTKYLVGCIIQKKYGT